MSAPELLTPPGWAHPLGTDELGREVLERFLLGGVASLTVGGVAVGAALGLGAAVALGSLPFGRAGSAALRGAAWVGRALPSWLLVATLLAGSTGLPAGALGLLLGLMQLPGVALWWRREGDRLLQGPIAASSMALGAGPVGLLIRHGPGLLATPLRAQAGSLFVRAVLAEGALTLLGAGLPLGSPSWGQLYLEAALHPRAWWLALPPLLASALLAAWVDGFRNQRKLQGPQAGL